MRHILRRRAAAARAQAAARRRRARSGGRVLRGDGARRGRRHRRVRRAGARARGARRTRAAVAAARVAAADETRHARVAAHFARRFGAATLAPVEIDAVAAPSLETLAEANAREGCVLETYGAVVTQWQSRTARDRAVRRAFVNIARDELRHAELAFAVARWLHPRLDDLGRRRVREARCAAADELARDIARPTPPRLVAAVGLPSSEAARGLVADLRARLWT